MYSASQRTPVATPWQRSPATTDVSVGNRERFRKWRRFQVEVGKDPDLHGTSLLRIRSTMRWRRLPSSGLSWRIIDAVYFTAAC